MRDHRGRHVKIPEPPLIEQGVTQADIDAYGVRCFMAGYRLAFREMAAVTREFMQTVLATAKAAQHMRRPPRRPF